MSTAPERSLTITEQPLTLELLSPANIRTYICPKATDTEIMLFFTLCKVRGYNPFLKEAYLVKYGSNPATMIIAKDTFLREAQMIPDYRGFEAGIIVQEADKTIQSTAGTFYQGKLLGGWAKVYRDGKEPFYNAVSIEDYVPNNPKPNMPWGKLPATMIRKVALVQSLREAFPEKFGGLYEEPEMDQALPTNVVLPVKNPIPNPNREKSLIEASQGKDKIQEMEDLMDTKKENFDAKELIQSTKGTVTSRTLTPENITDINPEEQLPRYPEQLPRYPAPDDLETEAIEIDMFMARLYELSGSPQYIIDSEKKLGNLPALKQDSFVFMVREKKYCGWGFNAWPSDKKDENKRDNLKIIHPAQAKFPLISFRFDDGKLVVANQTTKIYGEYELIVFLRATGFAVNWVIVPQRVYEAYKAEYR